jgi:outer membrane protein OmpA-like peptidoglycan-associated protein
MRLLPLVVIFILVFWFALSSFNERVDRRNQETLAGLQATLEAAQQASIEADQSRFDEAINLLNAEPGLVVTQVHAEPNGVKNIVCLKDNLARDPTGILIDEGKLEPSRFTVISRPYVSLDEGIVHQRVLEAIPLLPTVTMEFDGLTGLLTLSGSAPMGWILDAREKASSIAGVIKLDTSLLSDPKSLAMETLMNTINGVVIHFPTNKDEPVPEDYPKLIQAVDKIVELEKLAEEMQMNVSLVIYGHADATGQDRRNYELSEQRTKTVAALLYGRGSTIPISNYGLGSEFSAHSEEGPPIEDPDSRKIELRVRLTQGVFSSHSR